MKGQIKKTIAILLAVCFLVSLTATAVSAANCPARIPIKCPAGTKLVCDPEGYWTCERTTPPPPCSNYVSCLVGFTKQCINGTNVCKGITPCSQPQPTNICGHPDTAWEGGCCRAGYWTCCAL
jgi:hypothetical protein